MYKTDVGPEIITLLSRLLGPGERQQMEQQLRSRIVTTGKENFRFIPYINDHYPSWLRLGAASLSCTAGLPQVEHLIQDVSIDIRDGVFDGAPLAVKLGAVPWVISCLRSPPDWGDIDEHDEIWHQEFARSIECLLDIIAKCPPLELSVEGLSLCKELCSDSRLWTSDGKENWLAAKIFVAVAMFLRSKGVLLHCCPRCQILYARFFSDTALAASFDGSPLDSDDEFFVSPRPTEDPVTGGNIQELDGST